MTINIDELRAKKEGKLTPKALVTELLEEIEEGNIESVVYVIKTKDDMMDIAFVGSSVEAAGMLSIGQAQIANMMLEEE